MQGEVMDTKPILTTLAVILPMLILSCCTWTSTAMPASVDVRSTDNHQATDNNRPVTHIADGILCDLMMTQSDFNRNGKLSAAEIAWFYRTFVGYTQFVAESFGREFIEIADSDGNLELDRNELLRMLVEMNASSWTRR